MAFSLLFTTGCFFKNESYSNRVVVKVDDERLSAKEFAVMLADRLKVYDALTVKDEKVIKRIKDSVINDFIVQKVTEGFAKRNSVLVRKEELEAEINTVRAFYPDDLTFKKALAEQGLSFQEWSGRVKDSLLQKLVLKKIKDSLEQPTEEELKTFYDSNKELFREPEQVKLAQIVLKSENDAKQIQEELRKGKKLSDLAREFSVAPEAAQDGEIGWIEKGTLEVFDKAFSMPVGQKSGILKSPYGFHILEVKGKKPETVLDFSEAKPVILKRIMEKKEQATYSQWLEFEIKRAKIFKDDALIETIQVETKN